MSLAISPAAVLRPILRMLLSGPTSHARAPAGRPAGVPGKIPFDIRYGAPIRLDDGQQAVATSLAEGQKHNWRMAIAVIGPVRPLIAEAEIDGTQ